MTSYIKPKDMLNINTPWNGAYQVRIVRDGKERSRLFSWRPWGGRSKALAAAKSWRDQVCTLHGETSRFRSKLLKSNLSTGILGVCKSIHTDKRRTVDHSYLVYGVHWIDWKGKKRCKGFRVGNVDDYDEDFEYVAITAALAFRRSYVKHRRDSQLKKFNPEDFNNWREDYG